ncbi:MAG: EpsG family protein [Sphingobacteriaceae bacterium]|nr:EpsG family protein [Sphingobacteriaceae bacterium]
MWVIVLCIEVSLIIYATTRMVDTTTDSIFYVRYFSYTETNWYDLWYRYGRFDVEIFNRLIPMLLKKSGLYFSYVLIFFIYALIAVYFKTKIIQQHSPYLFLSLLVYVTYFYSYQEMVVMRNGVAIAICFSGVGDIVDRKWLKYYFKIILAIGFHSAAIFFVPFYFLNSNSIKPLRYVLFLVIFYILGVLGLSLSLPFLSDIDRISSYVDNSLLNTAVNLLGIMELAIFFSAITILIIINKKNDLSRYEIILSKIFVYSLLFRYMFCNISGGLATRFSDMGLFSLCIILALICKKSSNKIIVSMVIFSIVLAVFIIRCKYNAFPLS